MSMLILVGALVGSLVRPLHGAAGIVAAVIVHAALERLA